MNKYTVIKEEFKNITGFHGDYQISNYGKVKSFKKDKVYGKLLSLGKNKDGYLQCGLNQKTFRVHILVAEYFIGKKPGCNYEVCHNDGDPANNFVLNLRWDTHKNNMRDMAKHNTLLLGENSTNNRLTKENVLEIIQLYHIGLSNKQIAAKYNVQTNTICNILSGRTWSWLTGFNSFNNLRKIKTPRHLSAYERFVIQTNYKKVLFDSVHRGYKFTSKPWLSEVFDVSLKVIENIV